ncbi:MAG TPA: hypothetical protein VLU43_10665 [Anaeromyxobacteraceae bacterium]|nr:hypothetical protein [Anaeromyxobacteraceae bacterium]
MVPRSNDETLPPGGLLWPAHRPRPETLAGDAHLPVRRAIVFAMQVAGIVVIAAGLTALTLVAVWGIDLLAR